MTEKLMQLKKELEKQKSVLIDVREEEEWVEGHLKLAKLLPLSELQQGIAQLEGFNKETKVYLHCRSGQRVLSAAPFLEAEGFKQVVPLKEGFEDLKQEGFEVE